MAEKRLTGKQRAFAYAYVTCLNGTEAARRAGYKGNDNVLAGIAYDNRRNPKISALIDKLFNQQIMSKNEILARLTELAAADLVEVTDETGNPDWERARRLGKTHLVKKIKRREITVHRDKSSVTTVTTEIELHDPQRAIDMLGKYHELFTNKLKIEDLRGQAVADIRAGLLSLEALIKAGFERELALQLFREAGVAVEIGESQTAE